MLTSAEVLGEIDLDNSVLFLGSGFSLAAKNINGESPPNGKGLRRHFLTQLGLPADTDYDFQILADEFSNNDPKKLRDALYNIFRIKSLDSSQEAVLEQPWQRIYTTNYDDCVETYRANHNLDRNAFDVSEPVPSKLPHGSLVHLHGSIRHISAENVRTSLVLGEASYVNQYLTKTPWYDQFQRDISFSSALYIIGYSLADYHIAALLLANPTLAPKTFFIQGPNADEMFVRRTQLYGRTLFVGTAGFVELLKKAPRRTKATDIDQLKSFRSLSPTRDRNKAIVQPTANEVYDLLVYGEFDMTRMANSQPSESYAIARAISVEKAVDIFERKKALVVDGRTGNGKSLFLHLLAFSLTKKGWRCFMFRAGHPNISRDLEPLRNFGKVAIFVDQYANAQDSLIGLRTALPDAKFVIEIRTGTFEVRYHEIEKLLPKPFDRISLSRLERQELHALTALCNAAGLPAPNDDDSRDLRDILLSLFRNVDVRRRIEDALKPLFENHSTRSTLVMTMLLSDHQNAMNPSFIRSVIGSDPFLELKPMEYLTKEIFDISADSIRARSSVFSSFVIEMFLKPEEIADSVVKLILAAAARRDQPRYRVLMSSIMAFSSLSRTLRNHQGSTALIVDVYERLRFDERVNGEPLFWLQFAIAMVERSKLDIAREYIQTAYRKAELLPGFKTYQIDTQAFRIALLSAAREHAGNRVSNIEQILSGMESISSMLSQDSHRVHAVRVLENIPQFIASRSEDLQPDEFVAVRLWLVKIFTTLKTLPENFKAISESERIRVRLENSLLSLKLNTSM